MHNQQFTKKQHYISQGLLRLFSDNGTHIYECSIPHHKVYRANISNAMEENCTYEYPLLEENTLEKAFADIEASFIPEISSIVNDVTFSTVNVTPFNTLFVPKVFSNLMTSITLSQAPFHKLNTN